MRLIRSQLQMNALDKAINFVAPQWGASRMRARTIMAIAGGYTGGRTDRRATQTWALTGNSPDSDITPDLAVLRDRSRDLVRNNPIATGALLTVVSNAVGSGLSLSSRPDAAVLGMSDAQLKKWKDQVEREFRLWAESTEADITGHDNFYGLQTLAFRSTLESGDNIALLPMIQSDRSPYQLKIQLIEADRLASPREKMMDVEGEIVQGIEFDQTTGRPKAYHIRKYHPGSFQGRSDWAETIVQARGAITGRRSLVHLFERMRPGQSRGVPYLAPVIETLKQLDRYSEAEIMAAVVNAMLTVFIKTPLGDGIQGDLPEQARAGINPDNEIMLGSGTIVDLAAGEEPVSVAPTRPNAQFDPFVISILRQVGVSLGLPFEILVKHFTASYSAARAALLEAWRFFRLRREFIAQQFCDPIYEVWMEEAISLGRIDCPGFFADPALRRAYLQADWIGDAQGMLDPLKEAQAADQRLNSHLSTHAEEMMQMTGGIWDDKFVQMGRENEMLKAAGMLPPPPPKPGATADNGGSDLETSPANKPK